MEWASLVKMLWPVVVAYGPAAIGWVVAILALGYMFQRRKEASEAIDKANQKLIDAKDEYIEEMQLMNDKLSELNRKHMEVVGAVTEARVEDLKELTADYNKLASETLRAMDRFVVALEVSNMIKSKKRGGE